MLDDLEHLAFDLAERSRDERGSLSEMLARAFKAEHLKPRQQKRVKERFHQLLANERLIDFAIERATGKEIVLALEPEPCCFLETTEEAIAFFDAHLFGADAIDRFVEITGVSRSAAAGALRRHLGLCFDVCHAAVVFEDISVSLDRIAAAGIRIAKIQLSSALKLPEVNDGAEALLKRFDDGIYLHQTYEARDGRLTRYVDLPDAFAALRRGESGGEWRVHCHVPLFEPSYGALQSTRDVLSDVLGLCRTRAIAPHLEVETYTWGVLPDDMRTNDINGDIARELTWVRSQLDA